MFSLEINKKLAQLKKNILVIDIETSAFYSDGSEVSIKSNYDEYITHSKVKWFGAYSFKYNNLYLINAQENPGQILKLLSEHNILVGFNNSDFDYPILVNNGYIDKQTRYINVDCWEILGTETTKNRKGYSLKDRATLMGYDLPNNSFKTMCEVLGLEAQKGEIDYHIFQKDEWTEVEQKEICAYLSSDVLGTKQMFDMLWTYWYSFTELLDEKSILDLSWLRSSIASVTYKASCNVLGEEPTYSETKGAHTDGGGNVYLPKYEEAQKVWYLDFSGLYPHIISQFNLCAEISKDDLQNYEKVWHGSNLFEVKGYYNISSWHPLSKYIAEKLKERTYLKEHDKDSPMIYTLKILLNAFYGILRSPIFEKVYTPNVGEDICFIGRQIQQFTKEMLEQFGFEVIAGDTDSIMAISLNGDITKQQMQEYLKQIINIIKENVPFPVDTFKIAIEKYVDYITFPFAEQPLVEKETRDLLKKGIIEPFELRIENKKKILYNKDTNEVVKIGASWIKKRVGAKKNYLYIYTEDGQTKLKIVGLPISKSNATELSMKIFKECLEPTILQQKTAKFPKKFIDALIDTYLQRPEIMQLMSIEHKVQPARTYKNPSQLQCQISNGYFDGEEGAIRLIKNSKIGKAGKGDKYCTIAEALEGKLTAEDIDLEKVKNELQPFIKNEELLDTK
jgi:DNA polymerase elongation subunit (family B)